MYVYTNKAPKSPHLKEVRFRINPSTDDRALLECTETGADQSTETQGLLGVPSTHCVKQDPTQTLQSCHRTPLSPQPRDHPGLTAGVCSALTDWQINKTLGTLFAMVVFLFTVTVLYSFRKGHLFIYHNSTNAFHAIQCYSQALGAKLEAQASTLLYSATGSSSNYWYYFS